MKAREIRNRRTWTPEMERYLAEHYSVCPAEELATYFGVTKSAVEQKAHKMCLEKEQTVNRFNWTPEKIAYLQENYATERIKDMVGDLGCHRQTLHKQAKKLGLERAKKRKEDKPNGDRHNRKEFYGFPNDIGTNTSEVTDATRTLICSCALDGLTSYQMALLTSRTEEQCANVLAECKENGYFNWIKSRRESEIGIRCDRSVGRLRSGVRKAGVV